MQRLLVVTLAIATSVQVLAPGVPGWTSIAHAQEQAQEQPTLASLTERAERDVARLVRAARKSEDPLIAPDSETGKPFWAALKNLNDAVLLMGNGAALKDDSFHLGLTNSVRATAASFATYQLSDAKDDAVASALDAVEAVVATLEGTYSKPAARARKGGALTDAERKKLDVIRAKQALLEKRLEAIAPKVQNNPKARAAIDEIRRRSHQVRNGRYTVGDFASGLLGIAVIDGLVYGSHWWWGLWGTWYPEYAIEYASAYEDALVDIAYDWDTDGALEFDPADLPLEDDSVEIDSDQISADLYEINTDLSNGLGETELSGLSELTDADLADDDFGFVSDSGLSDMTLSEDAISEGLSDVSQEMQLESIGGNLELEALEDSGLSDLSDTDFGSDDDVMDLGGSDFDAGGFGADSFGGFDDMGMDSLGSFDDF